MRHSTRVGRKTVPAPHSIDIGTFNALCGAAHGNAATYAFDSIQFERIPVVTEQLLADDAANAELGDRVKQFLASQHFASFRRLDVTVSGDGLVLHGRVPSFHERQLAVARCRRVAGVHRVVDLLTVSESLATERSANNPFLVSRRPK